ncbi:serine protein kinase RIO [Ktedonosporobacter rubrisoli]|uniref:non-specific serine/threonine protein kinase n=1 Tax=Ktedonosporobacter rubrisoli TaxID=2509675 RepID=A0A4P6JLH1_KTERU|nr:RIO1 family regulatory kinase/ATPase [Ktedonosporobacter rubrisoli]QBD75923.1 serine protein kinase RIO [Ktedonosporobacter rubrisoli]
MSKRQKYTRSIEEQEELAALEELTLQQDSDPIAAELDPFIADGLITEVLYRVKSGKEATVYCCRAHPRTGVNYLAAKIYSSRNRRNFKNDSIYREGRVVLDSHLRRAIKKKSAVGRQAEFGMWIHHEFETLNVLHKAGSLVPRPYASSSSVIIMEYVGDEQQAAPGLYSAELKPGEAARIFDQLIANIQLWLGYNYVHGDLSSYNILYWQGQIKIIDFPQAVDPRFNGHAYNLLLRDIENVCKYAARYGLERDAQAIAGRMWEKFVRARL